MKKVLVFGTFDVFHKGHENFLKQARKFGDHLTVVVARDKTVKIVKKKEVKNKEQKRIDVLVESQLADNVILGSLRDKYAVLKKVKPDVICLGYDQAFFVEKLPEKLHKMGLKKTKIIKLKAYKPKIYKSSKLKK